MAASQSPRSPFDGLPPFNRAGIRKAICASLKTIVNSLCAFCESVETGSKLKLPSAETLELFRMQIDLFRPLSSRQQDAKPIAIIRNMDHDWKKVAEPKSILTTRLHKLNWFSTRAL